ncbi:MULTISPECIES: LysR family transcriptional regulator [unclassified Crossiella]|uniref:LysR family transcriptional regulator n=1 Tax=unclassified Crossiella TaxID=2620835 RepID=UPI001FFE93EF|nr:MULTISPECIES: LysR family transcriptional regulator [unclassified Crossiella]MCK2240845.1 LysR family transcriptional regulator [Crossiella sp. S99.2]MCK2254011.1 LysR family transcriptional regulator [Crossiella sp. S99.1]
MELELRHLRVICTVADTGSVTKAAARLGLAQPALTAQLNRIERALGGTLFERDRRGSRPTPLGELVLARARMLLPAVSELREEAARLANSAGEGTAHYRIGATNGPMLGGLMHHLGAARPQARISPQSSWSADELTELVAAGRLDYALVGVCGESAPPVAAGVRWRLLAVDPVFVLLPEDHPLADKDEVELSDLAEARWSATPGDGCFGDCFAAACARAGFAPRDLYETDVVSCVDLVRSGDAIALCQPTFREMPGVIPVPIAGIPLRWRQFIGWHSGCQSPDEVARLAGHALSAYADVLARSPRYTDWLAGHPGFGMS